MPTIRREQLKQILLGGAAAGVPSYIVRFLIDLKDRLKETFPTATPDSPPPIGVLDCVYDDSIATVNIWAEKASIRIESQDLYSRMSSALKGFIQYDFKENKVTAVITFNVPDINPWIRASNDMADLLGKLKTDIVPTVEPPPKRLADTYGSSLHEALYGGRLDSDQQGYYETNKRHQGSVKA